MLEILVCEVEVLGKHFEGCDSILLATTDSRVEHPHDS
jgi:hypothetical protein